MGRDNVDSLQAHALPSGVQDTQAYSMGDHTAPHYHSVDALSSNVLPGSTRERMVAPEPQAKPPSTKRRKINTCFPCKQRKVKCDRQQPYCGQCQKHRIPAERCVWSSDISMGPEMHTHSALAFSKPDGGHSSLHLSNEWAGAQGAELALDNESRAMLDRINHLERLQAGSSQASHEMHTAATGSQIDPLLLGTTLMDVNTERQGASLPNDQAIVSELAFWRSKVQEHRPSHAGENSHMAQMQAEQNIAADALAMFARHSQQGSLGSGDQAALQRAGAVGASMPGSSSDSEAVPRQNIVNALLDNATFQVNNASSPARIRAALDMLPNNQQTDYLLKILQTVDENVSYGISWRLVKMQLTNLRSQIANWNGMHTSLPENLDLSFLALLLVLLGLAAQYTESRFFIDQGFCTAPEQISTLVDAWVDSAQALMAMDDFVNKTNWNHIATLLFCIDHHALRGKLMLCFTTMAMLVRLAELQGYHTLGSAKDDEEKWSKSPASKQVCLSAVVGVPNTDTSRPETLIRPSIQTATSLPDRSHLVREAARRLWYKIASQDMILSTVVHRTSLIDPKRVTTQYPLNVDEEDLPDGETHVLPPVKADGRATINSLTPYTYQVAELASECGSGLPSEPLSHEAVLEYDAKFRNLLSSLPVYLRPDPTLEQMPEVRQEQSQRPYLAMHRLIVFEAVNHQLLMLHRGYMCRGHQEEKYAYSTRVAVDAARTIISCRQQIDNVHSSVQRHSVFRHHLFQAAVVLTLHLLDLTNKGQSSSNVAHQLRDDMALIVNYLTEANGMSTTLSTQLPHSQKVALKLLELLLAEDSNRRQNSGAAQKSDSSASPDKDVQLAIDSNSTNSIFQLAASASGSDSVNDVAAALASHMLEPQFGSSPTQTEFFASLDELMVPIY